MMPNRYNTRAAPIAIQRPKKVSLFNIPQCVTRSAFERYLRARATSTNPKQRFRVFIQPPERGRDCNQPGKRAKRAKGRPSANPKPAIATVNCIAPPFCPRAPTSRVPRMGPVQEKETMARVRAIKNMPPRLPILDLESTELEMLLGNVISKSPKKDRAKTRKITAKATLSQTLVEIVLRMLALFAFRK